MPRTRTSESDSSIDLSGRVAVVTGATRAAGIGAAICRILAALGCDICFTHWREFHRGHDYRGRDSDPADLQAEIEAMGRRVFAVEIDLRDSTAPMRLMKDAKAALGTVSILINNAAYWPPDHSFDVTPEVLDAHYAVNIRTPLLLIRELVGQLPFGTRGSIVNLTSGQSISPNPGCLSYITSKGAIEAATLTASVELASRVFGRPSFVGWRRTPRYVSGGTCIA